MSLQQWKSKEVSLEGRCLAPYYTRLSAHASSLNAAVQREGPLGRPLGAPDLKIYRPPKKASDVL